MASSCKAYCGPGLRLCGFFFTVFRWRGRFEGMNELRGDSSDFIDGSSERSFIRLRRLVEPGDFSHELERGRAHLFGSDGRIKIEERSNISAHVLWPREDFSGGALSGASGFHFG